MERGFTVQVVMTRAAEEFIRPLTFAALTGRKVHHRPVLAPRAPRTRLSSAIEHIRVAQENELLVVAPATADLLAKFAHGLADDFLTTTYLAFTGHRGAGAGDEHQHVESSGHAGESANAARARPRDRRTGRRASGLRHGRAGPPGRAGGDRRRRRCAASKHENPARSGRRNRSDHRRPHAGAARPRALSQQSLQRQDGLRAGRGSRGARRTRDSGFRTGESAAAARRRR